MRSQDKEELCQHVEEQWVSVIVRSDEKMITAVFENIRGYMLTEANLYLSEITSEITEKQVLDNDNV